MERMLTSHLEPGDRISLPTIARKLSLSVTPVRETLVKSSYSGLVSYKAKRGFFIEELSKEKAKQLYHSIVALECEAVIAAAPGAIDLHTLRNINLAFEKATGTEDRFRIHRRFHEDLCVFFKDSPMWDYLADIRLRLFMFERNYRKQQAHLAAAVGIHEKLIRALETGQLLPALAALRQSWMLIGEELTSLNYRPQEVNSYDDVNS